jgi:hypothetical protein
VTKPTANASTPVLSVVVPSVNGWSDLQGALAALRRESASLPLEMLVPERCGDAVRSALAREFPEARVLPVSIGTTIPEMRAKAFAAATGRVVAVIEDHVLVPPGWANALVGEIDRGAVVVGGAVENAATTTLLDRAAFLCEYSHCLPPIAEGSVSWLTGNNVAYRRDALDRFRAVIDAGHWENHLHDAMRAAGIDLVCRPSIVIGHKKHYTFMEYFSQRFLYARSYAGARVQGAPLGRRLFYAAASAALPALLFARIASRVLGKTRNVGLMASTAPLILVFVSAWAWGEFVGYTIGPGDSLARVC